MRVLAVGAHPADVELGCGGALLAHRDRGDEIHLLVLAGPGGSPPGYPASGADIIPSWAFPFRDIVGPP